MHQPSSVLGNACAVFNLSGTACLAPAVAADVATAVRAWQRLQAGPLQCMLDARRTLAEVTVLGLEGRLGEVRDVAAAMLGPSAKAATALMTGAWRALPAKAFRGDNATAGGLTFITMADLASSRPPTSASDADVPFMSPDGAAGLSPLADIVEYALCQGHAVAVHDITEKVFHALLAGSVPVYVGDAASLKKLAPPHSVIYAADFADPAALAAHLQYLVSNASAYESYLAWRADLGALDALHRFMSLPTWEAQPQSHRAFAL